MGNDDILTDDYVAGLLSQEANDCSLKYSALGMDAYRKDKKPANMLKPNTRFLRHIIKGTDSHNKALLAKEAAESQARLKDLDRAEEAKRRKTSQTSQDIRRRQMGDIHAILGGRKRRRDDNDDTPSSSRDSRNRASSRRLDKDQGQDKNKDLTRDRHHERAHRRRLSPDDEGHSRSGDKPDRDRSRRERNRRRSQSQDSRSGDEDRRHRHRKRRDSPKSTERRRRSRSPGKYKSNHRHRSPIDDRREKSMKDLGAQQGDESDPLEDLIGPAPPPKYRGRGTFGGSSGIDRRFSETYDPKTDIQMDDNDVSGNYDDAVEAFRDRQKLKQNQQQRLRAAGFTDDQIGRTNKTEEDLKEAVRWSKNGEKRAWDQGKVVDSDGSVDVADVV